jgi:nitrite reductase/ring-hydroxylating ferredoxin subunit
MRDALSRARRPARGSGRASADARPGGAQLCRDRAAHRPAARHRDLAARARARDPEKTVSACRRARRSATSSAPIDGPRLIRYRHATMSHLCKTASRRRRKIAHHFDGSNAMPEDHRPSPSPTCCAPIDRARGLPNSPLHRPRHHRGRKPGLPGNDMGRHRRRRRRARAGRCEAARASWASRSCCCATMPARVRVFYNICRHRGMILVDAPRKIEGAIRCPYHSWCYAKEGRLVATPHVGGPGQNAHPGIDRDAGPHRGAEPCLARCRLREPLGRRAPPSRRCMPI